MANNIDSMTNQHLQLSGNTTQTSKTARSADGSTSATANSTASQKVDTVELTGDARLMQAVEKQLSTLSQVDSQRVDDVRARLDSGTYEMSLERTADKMISMDQTMPGGR